VPEGRNLKDGREALSRAKGWEIMKRGLVGTLTKIALVGAVLGVLGGCAVYAEPGYYRPYHYGYYGGYHHGGYYR
jgi:hypothetical protein